MNADLTFEDREKEPPPIYFSNLLAGGAIMAYIYFELSEYKTKDELPSSVSYLNSVISAIANGALYEIISNYAIKACLALTAYLKGKSSSQNKAMVLFASALALTISIPQSSPMRPACKRSGIEQPALVWYAFLARNIAAALATANIVVNWKKKLNEFYKLKQNIIEWISNSNFMQHREAYPNLFSCVIMPCITILATILLSILLSIPIVYSFAQHHEITRSMSDLNPFFCHESDNTAYLIEAIGIIPLIFFNTEWFAGGVLTLMLSSWDAHLVTAGILALGSGAPAMALTTIDKTKGYGCVDTITNFEEYKLTIHFVTAYAYSAGSLMNFSSIYIATKGEPGNKQPGPLSTVLDILIQLLSKMVTIPTKLLNSTLFNKKDPNVEQAKTSEDDMQRLLISGNDH